MNRLDTIRWLWDFHSWARPRVITAASRLPGSKLMEPGAIAGGLATGSIHDMLAHIVGAEEIWQRRWEGNAEATLPSGSDIRDLDDVSSRWQAVERDRDRFLGESSDVSLEESVHYVSVTRHIKESFPLWMTMLHLSNHTTHHRADVLTALTAFGQPPESFDLIDYLRVTAV